MKARLTPPGAQACHPPAAPRRSPDGPTPAIQPCSTAPWKLNRNTRCGWNCRRKARGGAQRSGFKSTSEITAKPLTSLWTSASSSANPKGQAQHLSSPLQAAGFSIPAQRHYLKKKKNSPVSCQHFKIWRILTGIGGFYIKIPPSG